MLSWTGNDVGVKLFVNYLPENCPVMRWRGGTAQKNNWTNSNTAVENSVEGVLYQERNWGTSVSVPQILTITNSKEARTSQSCAMQKLKYVTIGLNFEL